jgi:hypothetical protein
LARVGFGTRAPGTIKQLAILLAENKIEQQAGLGGHRRLAAGAAQRINRPPCGDLPDNGIVNWPVARSQMTVVDCDADAGPARRAFASTCRARWHRRRPDLFGRSTGPALKNLPQTWLRWRAALSCMNAMARVEVVP